MIINTVNDLHRFVAECNPDLQIEDYRPENRDDLDYAITYDLLDLLRDKYDFSWGQELPKITEEDFLGLYKEYERCVVKIKPGETGQILSTDENGKPKWINEDQKNEAS